MGKVLIINRVYKIKEGKLKGFKGKLVIYNALENKASLYADKYSLITTNSENLELEEM